MDTCLEIPNSASGFDSHAYRKFFCELTGNQPYDYQIQVARLLRGGSNILLRAPTGAGKTWAVLGPFLFGQWDKRPIRLIYALPLRTLAQGIYREAKEAVPKLGQPIKSQKDDRGREVVKPFVTLQTGEQPDDPFFDRGNIIVTTYDQLLSGVLAGPYGLSGRLHNINAAVLMGALVVFDEFHLMEPSRAFLTATACVQLFRDFCQCVWMTATATTALETLLSDALSVQSVPENEASRRVMFASLPSITKVTRRIVAEKTHLLAEKVLENENCRSVVLFNTVDRAQTFFDSLQQEMARRRLSVPVLLLHSRFFQQHRREKEEKIRSLFGKDSKGPAVLVATQVIEAGLDISSEHLHTELCPMNALVQRAGRCARFSGEEGLVHVYPLPDGERAWLPYGTLKQEDVTLTRTRALLQFDEIRTLHPEIALQWVQCVHADDDQEAVKEGWPARQRTCLGHIEQTAILRDPKRIADLIRGDGSQSIRVLICDKINRPSNPTEREALSMSRWTLNKIFKYATEVGWSWHWDEHGTWKPLTDKAELANLYVVCLKPEFAAYSESLGLRLGKAGNQQSPPRIPPPRPGYGPLRAEHWHKHAACVACESATRSDFPSSNDLITRGLRNRYGLDGNAIRTAMRSCALLHDLGKLQELWQKWAEAMQQSLDSAYKHDVPLAHTDFDPERPRPQSSFRRPPHSAASAYYGAGLIAELLADVPPQNRDMLASACTAAILAHHGGWLPQNMDLGIDKMWLGWERFISQATGLTVRTDTLAKLEVNFNKRGAMQKLLDLSTGPEELAKCWPIVALLTRNLRLSDQRATADGALE